MNLHRKLSSVLTFENLCENLVMPRDVTSPILRVGRFNAYYTYTHIYIYIGTDIDIYINVYMCTTIFTEYDNCRAEL